MQLPRPDARDLAGAGQVWPGTPEARCVQAIREWLAGLAGRRAAAVPVSKVVADLTLLLGMVPGDRAEAHVPVGRWGGAPLPGRVDYLGCGIVRLDEMAISALAALADGEDFRVTSTTVGPMLAVGAGRYLMHEESPQHKHPSAGGPAGQQGG